MSSTNEKPDNKQPSEIGGIPIRSKADEFDSEQMIDCSKCRRKSPPNRLECIYCGAAYVLEDETKKKVRPVLREPTEDESGLNIICFGSGVLDPESIELVSTMTKIEVSSLEKLFDCGSAIPLAVTGSAEAASVAAEKLNERGFEIRILTDKEIEDGSGFQRLRGLVPEGGEEINLLLFNNDEVVRLNWTDIELIVVGLELESSLETDEKHKKKKLDKVLATTQAVTDGVLIDIYGAAGQGPFRIEAMNGFDFSFLGSEKEFVASKNAVKTVEFLKQNATHAAIDESYPEINIILNQIWKPEEREDTKRIKMRGFGSFEKKKIQTSSNLKQFSMYSRLQRLAQKQNKKT